MTYDAFPETTALPTAQPFPITEELPAVQPGRRKRRPNWAAGLFVLLLVLGLFLLVYLTSRSGEQAQPSLSEPAPTTAASPSVAGRVEPVVEDLDSQQPGYWQVVGVPDGLNVRSGPGTENNIVGALGAGQRHVFATGERATTNGAEWKQIAFGDNDTLGWVSARFLSSDTAPDESAPPATAVPATTANTSIVCFASDTTPERIARITFTDRTKIGGQLRVLGTQTVDYAVDGTLQSGQGAVTLSESGTGQQTQQTWVFSPASIDMGDGAILAVVACDSIAGALP